jgi:cobalt/nickel transport system permease protein
MHHRFLDMYAERDGLLQRLDPCVKIVALLLLVLSIVFTGPAAFLLFAGYALIVCGLIAISRMPLSFILKRSLSVIPFVLMIAIFVPFFKKGRVIGGYSFGVLKLTLTYDGLMVLWNVLIKSYLSVLGLIILTGTTKYARLLRGLEKLKCSKIIVMILSFMYRYIFLFEDELEKMKQAKASRTVGGSRWFHAQALANVLGSLFVRSYERGEAVYLAMLARGFDGDIRIIDEPLPTARDFVFLGIMMAALVGLRFLEKR